MISKPHPELVPLLIKHDITWELMIAVTGKSLGFIQNNTKAIALATLF